MANQTDPQARQIHGSDPQHLMEKILRLRVYESRYWKETCFGLNAASLVAPAAALTFVGGATSASTRPAPFACLLLKMLQVQPEPAAVRALIEQPALKYVRALGAFYWRLTARAAEVYAVLEPLLADYRKLAARSPGGWAATTMDAFVDELLSRSECCGIALPRLTQRAVLVDTGALQPRESLLDEELREREEEGEEGEAARGGGGGGGSAAAAAAASSAAAAAAPPARSRSREREAPARSYDRRRDEFGDGTEARRGGRAEPPKAAAAPRAPALPAAAEGSVEAWNEARAKLGLKPLS